MSSNPSPSVAALLSFLFPGAGQIYAGDVRKGIVWAIPMVIFIVGLIWLIAGGQMLSLLSGRTRIALLVLNAAFFFYHVAAMLDAYGFARSQRVRSFGAASSAPLTLALLVALAIVLHGVPEAVGAWGHDQFAKLFPAPTNVIPPRSTGVLPTAPATSAPPAGPSPSSPALSPSPSGPASIPPGSPPPSGAARICPQVDPNWAMAQDGRLNILLIGSDSRAEEGDLGGASLRTDSMILMTIELETCKTALFSFPRNMMAAGAGSAYPEWFYVPLAPESAGAFPDGRFPQMLNALWRRAAETPTGFVGSEGIGPECASMFNCIRGWRALVGTIQELSGVQIDGLIAVNLKGFVALVDNLPQGCPDQSVRAAFTNAECYGGVWMDIPARVVDDRYHTSQQQLVQLRIERGCQFFDGEMTLAYARSRHQDSDYQRGRRQQYVLTQIRKQLDPLAMLPNIPALLQAAQANLFTTAADSDIQFLAQVASGVDAERIYRYDFAPNRVRGLGSMQALRDKVNGIFSEPEPRPAPEPDDPAERCPPR